eukprot:tig00000655_g2830.t1
MYALFVALRLITFGFAGFEAALDLVRRRTATAAPGREPKRGRGETIAKHGDEVELELSLQARAFIRQLWLVKIPAGSWREARRKFHSLGWLLPAPPPLCDFIVHKPYPEYEFDPAAGDSCETWGATWVVPKGPHGSRVVFFLHGGGLIANRPKDYAFFLAHLAQQAGARVFAVDYRWAPEHRWPAQLDDAERAYEHLVDPAGAAVAPADILFAGDSAGAGLAAHLLVLLRDKAGGAAVAVDRLPVRGDTWSAEMNRRDPMIDADMPAVSRPCTAYPLPSHVPARDSDSFTARARHAGVQVELQARRPPRPKPRRVAGMFHVFPVLVPFLPEAWRGLAVLAAFLAHAPATPPTAPAPASSAAPISTGGRRQRPAPSPCKWRQQRQHRGTGSARKQRGPLAPPLGPPSPISSEFSEVQPPPLGCGRGR